MESNFTDLKHKDMIKQIEGLKKYTDCSMPSNEKQRIEKAECAAYNQAIADVVKLFSIHNVVWKSEQLPQDKWCKVCKLPTDGEKCYSQRCPI